MRLLARLDTASVEVDGRRLSGEDLIGAVGAVAARVAGAGVVAVEATPTLETVVAVVGGLAAGVTVVPVPADSGPRERQHILSDAGASMVLGADLPVDVTERRPLEAVDGGRLMLYTSGTTGPPKGVPVTEDAMVIGLEGLADAWDWSAGDVLAHGLPLFHVHGLVLGILGPLHLGGRVVHTGRPTPANYAAAVEQAGATVLFGVPTVWSRIVADPTACAALAPARLLVSGSAPLPVPTFEGLVAGCGQAPVERYGMTETLITLAVRADGARRPGWVGVPLPGVRTRVLDEAGDEVPADGETVGDLEVRGPTVMSGYHGLATNPFTADGWFSTGDLAAIAPDGYHRILGRRSTDLVKSGGYRIGTGEVEASLLAHPAVREAAVVGEPDADLGAVLVAYVVADGVAGSDLIDFVARDLSAHKRPRRVELVDSLPRNAMGKVNKRALG